MTKKPISPSRSLEQFAEDRARERFSENAEIARTARALRSANDDLTKQVAELEQRLGVYERLDRERLAPPEWLTPTKQAKDHTAIPCMLLTDIHWGEVVRPAEVDGLNCYTVRIAEQRVRRAFEGAICLSRDYLSGLRYDGFQLFLGGDLLSGIIHEELRETNQETVIQSVLGVVEQLHAGLNLLSESFDRVNVAAVVGNHGRLTRKPRAKFRAQESLDWLVYKLLEREFRGHRRVTMQVGDAADQRVTVYRTPYTLTHGDQFRGGSGISSFLAPLLLGVHRKTKRDSAAGKTAGTLVMGHFHTSYFLNQLIVGGSVIGYSEFSYVNNLPFEEPQAAFWMTTPERGITVSAPVFVQDRKAESW